MAFSEDAGGHDGARQRELGWAYQWQKSPSDVTNKIISGYK